MMQNPSTNTNKVVVKPQKITGNLKRDINLLPANEVSEKIARRGTMILAVFVGTLLLAYFVIFLPAMQTKDLQEKAANAKNELAASQKADAEYKNLVEERNTLKGMIDSLDSSDKIYLQPADAYKQLSDACPDAITLYSATISSDGLTIDGFAANDNDLAQFIVNLRSEPQFLQVNLSSVTENPETSSTMKRVFELTVSLPAGSVPIPAASQPAGQAAAAKGGDGK